jgi:DNA-binding transcriptional LysR family regulator
LDLLGCLETFVRVVDAGSLSKAARALKLSLPAVSRQLAALEGELEAPLIVRTTRRMTLTPAGRDLHERARRILHDVEEARELVAHAKSVHGTLVVSAPVSLGLARIVPSLPALFEAHPHLAIDLRLEDDAVDLVGEGVDVAVRAGLAPPNSAELVSRTIMTWRRVLVASPAYLRRHAAPKTPEALASHAALLHRASTWRLEREGDARVVEMRGALHTATPIALRDAAIAGMGIAFLPEWLASEPLASGALRAVLPEWRGAVTTASAIHRVELRKSPRVRAFLDHLTRG